MSDTTQKKPDPVLLWWNGLSKENKISIFATAGAVAAAIAVFVLVILPAKEEHGRLSGEAAELREKVEAANKLFAQTADKETEAANIETQALERVAAETLEPLNGSLAAAATLRLAPIFDRHGISVMGQGNMGVQGIILPATEAKTLPEGVLYFTRQPISFMGQGSFWDFVEMLHDISTNQPTATLTALSILSNPTSAESQDLSFTLEWPVVSEKPAGKK